MFKQEEEHLRTQCQQKLTGRKSNSAKYQRMIGNRTMEDMDIDEADFQHLLAELTDVKNECAKRGLATSMSLSATNCRLHSGGGPILDTLAT